MDKRKIPVYRGQLPPAVFRDLRFFGVINCSVYPQLRPEEYLVRNTEYTEEEWEKARERSFRQIELTLQERGEIMQHSSNNRLEIIADVNIVNEQRVSMQLGHSEKKAPAVVFDVEAIAYIKR